MGSHMRSAALLTVCAILVACTEAQYRGRPYGRNPGGYPVGYPGGRRGGGGGRNAPHPPDDYGHRRPVGGGYGGQPGDWGSRRYSGDGRGNRRKGQRRTGRKSENDLGGCGGRKQECCQTGAPCEPGLQCKLMGDRSWVSATGRCVKNKKTRHCGQEGMDCCAYHGHKACARGLQCAANMCRNPSSAVDLGPPEGVVGQTTVSASGWLMIKVRARGGKCFVKIRGEMTTNVDSFGEGTFGEVFGELSGMAECEGDAQGKALGYIRAEVLSSATLTEDGDCIIEGNSNVSAETNVQGHGITLVVGGAAGGTTGCNRRRLRVLDYIPV